MPTTNDPAMSSPAPATTDRPERTGANGSQGPGYLRVLWDAWQSYAHRAGGYQSQVLLSLVYFLVLGPSAYANRLAGNHLLDLRTDTRTSFWLVRRVTDKSLASMEREF